MDKIKPIFILALLICLEVKAESNKFWDYHGLTLGSSEQAIISKSPKFSFSCKDEETIRKCDGYFINYTDDPSPFVTGGSKLISLGLLNDKLVTIHIQGFSSLFDENYKELEKEYGLPIEHKKQNVETLDGKVFENHIILWHNGTSTIQYDRYWLGIGRSRLLFMLKE